MKEFPECNRGKSRFCSHISLQTPKWQSDHWWSLVASLASWEGREPTPSCYHSPSSTWNLKDGWFPSKEFLPFQSANFQVNHLKIILNLWDLRLRSPIVACQLLTWTRLGMILQANPHPAPKKKSTGWYPVNIFYERVLET